MTGVKAGAAFAEKNAHKSGNGYAMLDKHRVNNVVSDSVVGARKMTTIVFKRIYAGAARASANASRILLDAEPSHRGGGDMLLGSSVMDCRYAARIESRRVPPITFVPRSTVTGRSVLSRNATNPECRSFLL